MDMPVNAMKFSIKSSRALDSIGSTSLLGVLFQDGEATCINADVILYRYVILSILSPTISIICVNNLNSY